MGELSMEQSDVLQHARRTLAREGMAIVWVPVGSEQYQRSFVQGAVDGELAALARVLVPMEDPQLSFPILRLSAGSKTIFFFEDARTVGNLEGAEEADTLLEWALASIIAGYRRSEAGLVTPEDVMADPATARNQRHSNATRPTRPVYRFGRMGTV